MQLFSVDAKMISIDFNRPKSSPNLKIAHRGTYVHIMTLDLKLFLIRFDKSITNWKKDRTYSITSMQGFRMSKRLYIRCGDFYLLTNCSNELQLMSISFYFNSK